MRRCLPVLCLAAAVLLSGCKVVPQIAGLVGGAAAGGASASPAVGFAFGVATAAATGAAEKWYARSREHSEQDAIAQVAGGLPVGGHANWHINHIIPIGNEHGELVVLRDIPNRLASCREVALHVAGEKPTEWFIGDICRRLEGWQFANAEPAIARWGYLQ